MLDKTFEFLYETQNQKKPSFLVYLGERKTSIFVVASVIIGYYYDYFAGVVFFAIFLWWDMTRVIIYTKAKLANKTNLFCIFNLIIRRFYKTQHTTLQELMAKKILIEKEI